MEACILDQNFETLCFIYQYESFIWAERYNEAGDFEIYMPVLSDVLPFVKRDNYIIKEGSKRVMVIEQVIIVDSAEDGAFITISGKSAESLLARRVIWGFTSLDGNLQNGIKKLLNENAISPTNVLRRIPNLVFRDSTDSSITSLTHKSLYEGENLYDAIMDICQLNNIGFRIVLENKQLVFELYNGKNRSYDQTALPYVIFSPEFDNLRESSYCESDSGTKTTAFIMGNGEGADPTRITTSVDINQTESSGLKRRETTVEAHVSTSYSEEEVLDPLQILDILKTKGLEVLAETYANPIMFDGEILNTKQFVLNEDYFVGDIVQVVNKFGIELHSRVIEMIESDSASGYSLIPTFEVIEDYETEV